MVKHRCRNRELRVKLHPVLVLLLCLMGSACQPTSQTAKNALLIPPLIDSKVAGQDIQLTIQNGRHQFFPGIESQTKGFSGHYLGPTIRLYRGENTRIRFSNHIDEPTTIHGHGLHVEGRIDGGPQNTITPGDTWDIEIPVRQQASTNWYHPHLMGKTAEHVHAGLAGLYLIEDDHSLGLPLPKTYGVDDLPLIVQDRDFTDGKMQSYSASENDIVDGKREDTLVVNGTVNAFVTVPKGWLRLRLLNASNARLYDFYLKRKAPFYKIATEGGFLEKPVQISSLRMAPGERNEIMIDLSDGLDRVLMATFEPADSDGLSMLLPEREVVEIRVNHAATSTGELPQQLNTLRRLKRESAAVIREFVLEMDMQEHHESTAGMDSHSLFSINGKSMDAGRIDERVEKGDVEIWRIRGDMMEHPFHMHGTSFLILSQDGRLPAPEDVGWKDVVVVDDSWTEVIMRFDFSATEEFPYMYHCHILEHEDAGMMGQFTVQ